VVVGGVFAALASLVLVTACVVVCVCVRRRRIQAQSFSNYKLLPTSRNAWGHLHSSRRGATHNEELVWTPQPAWPSLSHSRPALNHSTRPSGSFDPCFKIGASNSWRNEYTSWTILSLTVSVRDNCYWSLLFRRDKCCELDGLQP